jgi:hypothetical protein
VGGAALGSERLLVEGGGVFARPKAETETEGLPGEGGGVSPTPIS